ncbi:pseudouridine synthase [Syncephalis plumigaleata]|nr:pseudouridine synthase [Syncephalis plumigaleata]
MESLCMRMRGLHLQRAACSIRLPTPLNLNNARCSAPVYTMLVAHKHRGSARFNWRRIDWSDPDVTVFSQTVDDGSMRLDRLLREQTGFPQSKVQHLIVTRKVQAVRDGVILSKDETHARLKVLPGDKVAVYGLKKTAREIKESRTKIKYEDLEYSMEAPRKSNLKKLNLEILHKDDHLLVINKPWNLVVQGGEGSESHILPDYLEELKFDKPDLPRVVHRLDKLTTGVLLLARTRVAAIQLSELFREHKLVKEYVAQVAGWPKQDEGIIDAPLCIKGTPPLESVQLAEPDDEEQWRAITKYQVVDRREDVHCTCYIYTFMAETGRKHQYAHIVLMYYAVNTPITGDRKYGYVILGPMKVSRKGIVPKMGHYLHLHKITLPAGWLDPNANVPPTPTVITAPLPLYLQPMESMLKKLDEKAPPKQYQIHCKHKLMT